MAKPSTAHTVAPRLALSQKVEFFRSACAMCLRGGSMRQSVGEWGHKAKSQKEGRGGSTEHDGALKHRVFRRRGLPKDKTKSYALTLVEVPFNRDMKDECHCPVTPV